MQQRAGDGQTLAHAAGKSPHQASGARREAAVIQRTATRRGDTSSEIVELREESEIFRGGQFVVKQSAVADQANSGFGSELAALVV